MLRQFVIGVLTFGIPVLAGFECPYGTTFLERKDEAQWMKACLDTNHQLHGPFEIWSHPAESGADQEFHRTTKGQYTHGAQVGTWIFWDIRGGKRTELTFP